MSNYNFIDLSNQRFGRLTVVERVENKSKNRVRWSCICDCGNTVHVNGNGLKRGSTKSCGCMRVIDLSNHRFGRLTVIKQSGRDKQSRILWKCVCECGNTTHVNRGALRSGKTQSCGCLSRELTAKRSIGNTYGVDNIKHGHASCGRISPTYSSWMKMKERCCNPNHIWYKNYGGRGVTVCERWSGKDGFQNFLEDNGERPEGTSIDRIDPDGNYEPGNCRWSTPKEQANNRRQRRKAS